MKIISLSGPKQAGKDTSADILIAEKKLDGKLSFAAPLKEICMEVFDLHFNLVNDAVLKETPFKNGPITLTRKNLRELKHAVTAMLDPVKYGYNPNRASVAGLEGRVLSTPRELLQVVGTDFIREQMHKEWHVKAAFSDERLAKLKGNNFAVTDARFPNEFHFLVDRFGNAFDGYYIERKEAEEELAKATHGSEREVLTIKELVGKSNIITNNGTTDELKKKLLKLEMPKGSASKIAGSTEVSTDEYMTTPGGRKIKLGRG